MPKKNSLGGQFSKDIKGFENEYFFLKNLYEEKGWSLSALTHVIRRFVEGWRYDGLDKVHHTPESLGLERKVSLLRGLGHDRQSKIYFTTQYGEHLGEIKFKEVQTFQALSNSKEYKGMTDEEFKRYNNSRAITLKNMIKKYGKEEGTRVFNEYREKQRYKKSKQRYIDEFGEEQGLKIFNEINKKKVQSLENFQRRYGKEEGLKRYRSYVEGHRKGFSDVASNLFEQIESLVSTDNVSFLYLPKNSELLLEKIGGFYKYDFCIPELKFIIEFNGDVFHGNPQLFNESDCPNPFDKTITAKQMWSNDKVKIDLAKSKGFDVMVIWERDYRNDPEAIVESIIKTISEKLKNS